MTDEETSSSVIPAKAGIQFVVNAFAIRFSRFDLLNITPKQFTKMFQSPTEFTSRFAKEAGAVGLLLDRVSISYGV